MAACKTKKGKGSFPGPEPVVEAEQGCELNVAKVPNLPKVLAKDLMVKDIELSTNLPGGGTKIEFALNNNTHTDVILYDVYKAEGSQKFTRAVFGRSGIDPTMPSGVLEITAWACVEPSRMKQGDSLRKSYGGQEFFCGQAKVKNLFNSSEGPHNFALTWANIDLEIERACFSIYRQLTSEANLNKATKANNELMINSILGLRAMKIGAFTAKCVADGADLATTAEYAEGLNLSFDAQDCPPQVSDKNVDKHIVKNDPPLSNPEESDSEGKEAKQANDDQSESEQEASFKETVSTSSSIDAAKSACEYDNANLEELGLGGAQWNGEKNTCYYYNNQQELVNAIEPDFLVNDSPVDESVVQPQTPAKNSMSTGQKWGVSLLAIGGIFAASLARYKFLNSASVANEPDGSRSIVISQADTVRQVDMSVREANLERQQAYFDDLAATLNDSAVQEKKVLAALSNETSDRIALLKLNNELIPLEKDLREYKDYLLTRKGPPPPNITNKTPPISNAEGKEIRRQITANEFEKLKQLQDQFDLKSAKIKEHLWIYKIAGMDEQELRTAKAKADADLVDLEKSIADELKPGAEDSRPIRTQLEQALEANPDSKKVRSLMTQYDSLQKIRSNFDDVAVLKASLPDYLEPIQKKLVSAVPEFAVNPYQVKRSGDVDLSTKLGVDYALDLKRIDTTIKTPTGKFNQLSASKKYFSDWQGKGVAASIFLGIVGGGLLSFGLSEENAINYAEAYGERLSRLHFCKKQLKVRGQLSKGCYKLLNL